MQTASNIGLGRLSAADQADSHLGCLFVALLTQYVCCMYVRTYIQVQFFFFGSSTLRLPPPSSDSIGPLCLSLARMASTHTPGLAAACPVCPWADHLDQPHIVDALRGGRRFIRSERANEVNVLQCTDCIISRPLQSSVRLASKGRNNNPGRLVIHISYHRPKFFNFFSLFLFWRPIDWMWSSIHNTKGTTNKVYKVRSVALLYQPFHISQAASCRIAALLHCRIAAFCTSCIQAPRRGFFHGSDTLVTWSLGRFQDDSGSALHFHG
jgi:hypothetical protein